MPRPTLNELEARCQKPDFRTSGNWMARHISRPLALRVTWLISPWRVSANNITSLALVVAIGAAACFASGRLAGSLAGAVLLQLWYLLDHVDGQLARLHRTSSLDGIQFDYLMHHLVNLVIPCALGYGLWQATGSEHWLIVGFMFALAVLVLGLANDTRYKAFMARLKDVDRPLLVHRAGRAPIDVSSKAATRESLLLRWLRLCVHGSRKMCEVHVVMNFVTVLAILQCLGGGTLPMRIYLGLMAPLAIIVSVATTARDMRRGAAEREFAQWYGRQKPQPSPPLRTAVCDQASGLREFAAEAAQSN
jgi:phosphatidylglycerophosphate synthase